jgi:D-methionine transport system ATP-binding protein
VEQGSVFDIFADPKERATRDMLGQDLDAELPESFAGLDFSREPLPGSDLVLRLRFFGDIAAEPVMCDLIRRFDLDVNILTAHIDHLRNMPYGTLVIGLSGRSGAAGGVMALRELDLSVEVVGYVAKALRRAM